MSPKAIMAKINVLTARICEFGIQRSELEEKYRLAKAAPAAKRPKPKAPSKKAPKK